LSSQKHTESATNKEFVEKFGDKLIRAIKAASESGKIPLKDLGLDIDEFLLRSLSVTPNPVVSRKKRGDYSSNIALRIAGISSHEDRIVMILNDKTKGQKAWREKHPSLHAIEIAKIIVEQFAAPLENDPLPPARWRVEVSMAPPGFINLIDLQLGDVVRNHIAQI